MLRLRLLILDNREISLCLIPEERVTDESNGSRSFVVPISLDSAENMDRALDVAYESIKVLFASAIGVVAHVSFVEKKVADISRAIANENATRAMQGEKTSQLTWAKAILVTDQFGVTDAEFQLACDFLDQLVLEGNVEAERFVRENVPALKWLRDKVLHG